MLIREKSFEHIGSPEYRYIDIVKDVINLLPVYWFADELVCLIFSLVDAFLTLFIQVGLQIKTKSNPQGFYKDQALYEKFADVGR